MLRDRLFNVGDSTTSLSSFEFLGVQSVEFLFS